MGAYYNEIDPEKAQWIRELILAGVVAPGDVDERSITDVQPDDLRGYRQCHFFAGIAGWSYALRLAGWDDARPVWTGSCPCQSLSCAGLRKGHADERHLWPAFTASSPSAGLQWSLESRLRAKMDANGSPEYELTWKQWDMPAGPPICALRASPRHISDSDCIGWPTATATERSGQGPKNSSLMQTARRLVMGYPSPRANRWGGADSHGFNPVTAILGWSTPTAITATGGAALCKWGGTASRAKLKEAVGNTVLNGALNPAFPCWLMGYPEEWLSCADLAMRSFRKLRKRSSKRSKK